MSLSTTGEIVAGIPIKTAQCIPDNTLFSTPLQPLIEDIAGAFGGLLAPIALGVAIILAFFAIFKIRSHNASDTLKVIIYVLAIPIALAILLALWVVVFQVADNLCGAAGIWV